MTIIDFPTNRRARAGWSRRTHPTASAAAHRAPAIDEDDGDPPTGAWLDTYEQLAACCAEVVATPKLRVYDADWEELLDWIRTRLAALDDLKATGAPGAS
jgi:hypothetical protein